MIFSLYEITFPLAALEGLFTRVDWLGILKPAKLIGAAFLLARRLLLFSSNAWFDSSASWKSVDAWYLDIIPFIILIDTFLKDVIREWS